MEKKPDRSSSTARTASSVWVENSSKPRASRCAAGAPQVDSLPVQDHFQHELASHVGEEQRHEAGEGPAHRDPPAPAVEHAPSEQGGEYAPGDETEQGLVSEGHRLSEQ